MDCALGIPTLSVGNSTLSWSAFVALYLIRRDVPGIAPHMVRDAPNIALHLSQAPSILIAKILRSSLGSATLTFSTLLIFSSVRSLALRVLLVHALCHASPPPALHNQVSVANFDYTLRRGSSIDMVVIG